MSTSAPRDPEPTSDTKSLPDLVARPQARPPLHRGVCVGRYVLLDCVGEGGMGVVYKSYDPELERPVALKLLHAAQSQAGAGASPASARRERLLREAKALARLSHPNVLAIFDVGTFDEDVFLATEFVEGPTLGAWQREATRSRAEILRAHMAAGEGLAAAHRAGLVHRDYKPSNVIVGKDGRVRVLDFGLARSDQQDVSIIASGQRPIGERARTPSTETGVASRVSMGLPPKSKAAPTLPSAADERSPSLITRPEGRKSAAEIKPVEPSEPGEPSDPSEPSEPSEPPRPAAPLPVLLDSESNSGRSPPSSGLLDTTITKAGQILGTPRFMAPEQHVGRTADARSDQYSFCVTLYEALYGEFPFAGKGEEYAANVIAGRLQPAPPKSSVPRWLRQLLVRGLAVDPADRHPSMDVLLAALGRDPYVKAKRWLAIGGVAVAALAIVAVRQSRPAEEAPCQGAERKLTGVWDGARKKAVRDAFMATGSTRAGAAYTRAEAALDDYAGRWVGAHVDACEATRVRGEQSAEMLDLRVECLSGRLEELRAQVDVFTHADAKLVDKAVQAVLNLPRLDACRDAAALRAPIRPPSDGPTRAKVAALRTEIAQAKALQRAGKYSDALSIATNAAEGATSAAYRPLESEALFLLGDLQDDLGEYATAEHTLRRSAAAAIAGHHEVQEARALTNMVSEIGLRQAHFAEAHEWALLAEGAVARISDPFTRGELPRELGRLLYREGKYAESRASIEKCLAIWEPALGREDYAVAGPLTDLGNVDFAEGKYDDAIVQYARSLAVIEKRVGTTTPLLGPNLNNLGEVYMRLGEWDRAIEPLERAHALWEAALGPEHPKVALALHNLSDAYRHKGDKGDLARSEEMASRSLAIWRKALGDEHPDVGLGMHAMAEVQLAKGELDRALESEERGLAIREKALGPSHDGVAESLVTLGEIRLAKGRPAEAAPPLERAVAYFETHLADAVVLGDARFALARALATSDPARSRNLVARARASYAGAAGPLGGQRVVEIDAWVAGKTK